MLTRLSDAVRKVRTPRRLKKPEQMNYKNSPPVMESRDLVSVSRRVSRPVFWSLGLGFEGLRSRSPRISVSVSRLCVGYFLWSFARRSSLKKRFLKMIVQNLAVQRGQWLSFLCCYIVCELEKTIFSLPRLKFILTSIKNAHVPMNPQRVISATRGWEYFAADYLWTVFPRVLLWNP